MRYYYPAHIRPRRPEPLLFSTHGIEVLYFFTDRSEAEFFTASGALLGATKTVAEIEAETPELLIDAVSGVKVHRTEDSENLILAIQGERLFDVLITLLREEADHADLRTNEHQTDDTTAVIYNLGNEYLRADDPTAAMQSYSHVIQRDPSFALAYVNRASAAGQLGFERTILPDLLRAAQCGVVGVEGFEEKLADHLVAEEGFIGLSRAVADHRLASHTRDTLGELLERYLSGNHLTGEDSENALSRSDLVGSKPDQGVTFDRTHLYHRCLLADLHQLRWTPGERQRGLLLELFAFDPMDLNPELGWRVAYLQGLTAYSTFSADYELAQGEAFGLVFDHELIYGRGFTLREPDEIDDGSEDLGFPTDEVFELSGTEMPPSGDPVAYLACVAFAAGAQLALQATIESWRPAGSSAKRWKECSHLLAAYAIAARELGDASALAAAIDAMRRFSRTLGMKRADEVQGDSSTLQESGLETARSIDALNEASRGAAVLSYYTYETGFENVGLLAAVNGRVEESSHVLSAGDLIEVLQAGVGWIAEDQRAKLPFKVQYLLEDARLVAGASIGMGSAMVPTELPPSLATATLPSSLREMSDLTRLYFVPYGYLHNLPLHLQSPIVDNVLGADDLEVVYVPGGLVRPQLTVPTAADRRDAVVFTSDDSGDISFGEEVAVLDELCDSIEVVRAPSVSDVLSALVEKDIVHFACHGRFDAKMRSSYLDLGAAHRLYARDVLGVQEPRARLVFMNACVSGNTLLEGRGADQAMGIHSGLLRIGVRYVVGTLWSVLDEDAAAFAVEFYRMFLADGRPPGCAWIRAQARLRSTDVGSDIYNWGGHVLYGALEIPA